MQIVRHFVGIGTDEGAIDSIDGAVKGVEGNAIELIGKVGL